MARWSARSLYKGKRALSKEEVLLDNLRSARRHKIYPMARVICSAIVGHSCPEMLVGDQIELFNEQIHPLIFAVRQQRKAQRHEAVHLPTRP